MNSPLPQHISPDAISELLVAMADDEFVLGHRDAEWTGHSPILEEDLALSNLAQDELGHALVWLTINENLTGKNPDWMGFERPWNEFTCCKFVQYPKGDYAFTVVRQFLFDAAEKVRLSALTQSSFEPMRAAAKKILREEHYHLLHSQGMVERLGDATEESHRRMQQAVDAAFPQALGLFEPLTNESDLIRAGVITASNHLQSEWLAYVVPVLGKATLEVPVTESNRTFVLDCNPDDGGRQKKHTPEMRSLIGDIQSVYQLAPGGKW